MKFSAEDLISAHNKVKTGADFPKYVQDLSRMGVTVYESYVRDGSMVFYGTANYKVIFPGKYDNTTIATQVQKEQFHIELRAHQMGLTDYNHFLKICAAIGIERWAVAVLERTCTYYDCRGEIILKERIPEQQ